MPIQSLSYEPDADFGTLAERDAACSKWDDLVSDICGLLPDDEYVPPPHLKEMWAVMIERAFRSELETTPSQRIGR